MKTEKEKIIEACKGNIKHIIDLVMEIEEALKSDDENEIKLAAALARVTVDFLKDDAAELALKMVTHQEYQH